MSDELPRPSKKEAEILRLLIVGDTEQYGLELVRASNGSLKRGTIYTTLNRMEEKGYVESRQEEKEKYVSGIPRRLYKVTGLGERAYEVSIGNLRGIGWRPAYAGVGVVGE